MVWKQRLRVLGLVQGRGVPPPVSRHRLLVSVQEGGVPPAGSSSAFSGGRGAGDVTVAFLCHAVAVAPTGCRRVREAEGEKCRAERPSPVLVSLRVRGDRERQDQGGKVSSVLAIRAGSAVVSRHQKAPSLALVLGSAVDRTEVEHRGRSEGDRSPSQHRTRRQHSVADWGATVGAPAVVAAMLMLSPGGVIPSAAMGRPRAPLERTVAPAAGGPLPSRCARGVGGVGWSARAAVGLQASERPLSRCPGGVPNL